MKSLVEFINENIIIENQKIAKDVDKNFEDFITNHIDVPKTSLKKPKKLVVYPDGIGLHPSELKDRYGAEPYINIVMTDSWSNSIYDIPEEFYNYISKEFLESVDVIISISSDVLFDKKLDKALEDVYNRLPKVNSINLRMGFKISYNGKGKDTCNLDDIKNFFKKYAKNGTKIKGNGTIVDLPGWDPRVKSFYTDEILPLTKKYNMEKGCFVVSGKDYRKDEVPEEYR